MDEKNIICPHCKNEIKLSQSIIGHIEESMRGEYETCLLEKEEQLQEKEKELERSMKEVDDLIKTSLEEEKKRIKEEINKETENRFRLEMTDLKERLKERECRIKEIEEEELNLRKRQRELEEKHKKFDLEMEKKLEEEKTRIMKEMEKYAADNITLEMKDLRDQLREKEERLKTAQEEELKLRKKHRELEEKEKSLELDLQRKMDIQRKEIETRTMEKIQEEYILKEKEKDKTIFDLKEQIEIMKRKAEQGSQQQQGEVLELSLEDELSRTFPFDDISEVKKGQRGADIKQIVRNENGSISGTILWETKTAQEWSNKWVSKLKEDMISARADIGLLCSTILPKGTDKFQVTGDVIVTRTLFALPLAALVRDQLKRLSRERNISEGVPEKKDHIYNYITGSEFRQSFQGIVDVFFEMKNDLDSEKNSFNRIWKKREKSMIKALANLSGIYGSMQGYVGSNLPSLKNLEMEQITERSGNGDDPTLDEY
jgi:hypothetical protein